MQNNNVQKAQNSRREIDFQLTPLETIIRNEPSTYKTHVLEQTCFCSDVIPALARMNYNPQTLHYTQSLITQFLLLSYILLTI